MIGPPGIIPKDINEHCNISVNTTNSDWIEFCPEVKPIGAPGLVKHS